MTDVLIAGGTLTASRDDRTVSGMLIPYGEVAKSNLGRFSVDSGVFTVPEDVTVLSANIEHDREQPVARFLGTTETPAGREALFKVADGPEGDAVLDGIDSGERACLSAEVKNVVIRAGKAVRGHLFGAAFVRSGAFPSAALYASDTTEDVIELNGVRYARVPETQTPDGTVPPDEAAAAAESEAPVADDQTAPVVKPEDDQQTLHAALPGSLPKPNASKGKGTASTLFATLAGKTVTQAGTLMAALDQVIAADALPSQQQQWLGEIGATKTYVRRFTPLIQHDNLQGLKGTGWRFIADKTPTVGDYNGFPAQPTSTEVKTEAVTVDAARLAGAGAVDRAFLDFPTPEFWAGYFREFTNDYERKADAKARDAIISGATALVADAVPAGVATAFSFIVDGAAQILDKERGMPTFALVGTALWKQMLRTRAEDALAYLSAALGLEDGSLENFKIVPSSVASLVGKVVVGTREAATQFELPSIPVRVDTVNIATGGAERGVFGYHAELVNDATGLVIVAAA